MSLVLKGKCKHNNCSNGDNLKLYYCCNIQVAFCGDCAKVRCLECGKLKLTVLKSEIKELKKRKCNVCEKELNDKYAGFSCNHYTCLLCLSKKICKMVKNKQWQAVNQDPSNQIKIVYCSCYNKNKESNVGQLLKEYCFCCSERIQKNTITLKNGLIIKQQCKNNILFQLNRVKCHSDMLQRSDLMDLMVQSQQKKVKIDQIINNGFSSENQMSSSIKDQSRLKTKIQFIKLQPKIIPKIEEISCSICQQVFFPNQLLKNDFNLCQKCVTTFPKISYQQIASMKRTISLKNAKKKCSICSKYYESYLQEDFLCQDCVEENKKAQENRKRKPIFVVQQKKSKKCINCNNIIDSSSNDAQLSELFCQNCLKRNIQQLKKRSYNQKCVQRCKRPYFAKQDDFNIWLKRTEYKSYITSIQDNIVKNNNKSKYQKNEKSTQQKMNCIQQDQNYFHKNLIKQDIQLRSIIQQYPDNFVFEDEYENQQYKHSCYYCGYFMDDTFVYENIFGHKFKVCLSCFLQSTAKKR